MNEAKTKTYSDFVLPPSLVSKIDVSRLVSEAERVDDALTTADIRAKTGAGELSRPVPSDTLQEFLDQNELSLDNPRERSDLIKQLQLLKDKVPTIHMTFAVTADRESLEQLAQWLRQSVHPQVVISVGLQPALVAGVYLRTPNHVHDLSVRGILDGRHDLLVKELETLRGQ